MDEEELTDKLDLIEEDLLALIQDEGMTETRLEQFAPNILSLWGVKSVGFVHERVRYALLDLMKRDKYGMALTWALGAFTPAAQIDRLTDRRARLMKESEEFNVSEDTLRRWERRAMKPLARMIIERSEAKEDAAWGYQAYAEREGSIEERFEALKTFFDEKISTLTLKISSADSEIAVARSLIKLQSEGIADLTTRVNHLENKRRR